jgi:regulator of sigma E protease
VGDVEPGSSAAQAGLQPGDVIVRFGALVNPKWEDVGFKIITSVNEAIPVEAERDGHPIKCIITPVAKGPDRIGDAGLDPYMPAIIHAVEPGLPASKAGLKPGDEIVGIGGRKVFYFPSIAYAVQSGNGKPVDLDVLRAGQAFQVHVQPVYADLEGDKRWRIGFLFHNEIVVHHLPWGEALTASLEDNARNCRATFDVLGKILTKRMSPRSLSGPIGIAQISGEAYRAGIPELLLLVSFISLQLGIFNLLPIPVLDGGVILLLLVEGLMRRDLSLQVKERFVQVGIVFLLLLAAFVMYNDLVKTLRPY